MLVFLIVLISGSAWPDTIPVLNLQFDESQWEYACESYWLDIYVPAELTVEEYTFDCQFRIRGATSRSYPKKSLKLEFNDFSLFGYDELNLNAEFLDITRMRECLSYTYYRNLGHIVPDVHFVEVVFNGETQGVYLSVEDIDSDFLLNTDFPDEAVIYKCSDRYTTLDRVDDLEPYSKKTYTNEPWDDLLLLMYWLDLCPDEIFMEQLQERFYYSDLVSCVAANVLLGHGSTYYHNYHLILDETGAQGRWSYVTWDMDRTWWMYGPEFPYSKNSSNGGNRRNKLIWRMWCNKNIREDLFAEINRQYPIFEHFAETNTIDSLADLVAPVVEVDPFRDYTMSQFWVEVDRFRSWPEARYLYVMEQIQLWPFPFSINRSVNTETGMVVSWQNAGENCTWRIEVSADSLFNNPMDVVFEAFTTDTFYMVPFQFTGTDLWMQVYATQNGVEHRADNGPVRPVAEPYYAITGNLVINEINYMSSSSLNSGDWLEVISTDNETVSLAGWSVRDNQSSNLTTLGNLLINTEQCLIFSSDSFAFSAAYPTLPPSSKWLNFNLSDNGDKLLLIDPLGYVVDSLSYLPYSPWPTQPAGSGSTLTLLDTALPNHLPSSWGAGPFGGTPFSSEIWAPGWPARGAVSFFVEGPLPVLDVLSLQFLALAPVVVEINLYNLSGRTVLPSLEMEIQSGVSSVSIETSELPSGIYFVGVRNMGFLQTAKITVLAD